jgi:DNA-binding NtrC family response regulator
VKRILLLVEDDEFVAEAVEQGLRPWFHQVLLVSNPRMAIEAMSTICVDVIVSDYDLGVGHVTGVDLLELVALTWPSVRRVLYSGTLDIRPSDAAHAVVRKPASIPELLVAIGNGR